MEPIVGTFPIEFRKRRFTEIVKVQGMEQQSFGHLLELCFQLFPARSGQVVRPQLLPIAFYRVDQGDGNHRTTPGHGSVHPGEMVFHLPVLPIPGTVGVDSGRIIPLRLSAHAHP